MAGSGGQIGLPPTGSPHDDERAFGGMVSGLRKHTTTAVPGRGFHAWVARGQSWLGTGGGRLALLHAWGQSRPAGVRHSRAAAGSSGGQLLYLFKPSFMPPQATMALVVYALRSGSRFVSRCVSPHVNPLDLVQIELTTANRIRCNPILLSTSFSFLLHIYNPSPKFILPQIITSAHIQSDFLPLLLMRNPYFDSGSKTVPRTSALLPTFSNSKVHRRGSWSI